VIFDHIFDERRSTVSKRGHGEQVFKAASRQDTRFNDTRRADQFNQAFKIGQRANKQKNRDDFRVG